MYPGPAPYTSQQSFYLLKSKKKIVELYKVLFLKSDADNAVDTLLSKVLWSFNSFVRSGDPVHELTQCRVDP